jgi:AraC-like DNA-binding protein
MKIYPFKIPKPENNALIYQEDIEAVFYDKLHQHDEIQISFIEKGSGTLLVIDRFYNYNVNDILVIGSTIPHLFKSDKNTSDTSKMLSLFFTKKSFGEDFFNLGEFEEIISFFEKSEKGFRVTSNKTEIKNLFLQFNSSSKMKRFVLFLQLIKLISNSEFNYLSSFNYSKKYSDIEGNRMRSVFEYTIKNAHLPITLLDISAIANMTRNAFCKYFKKRTNKTYINFLTELRIENACKALQKTKEISVNEVAFQVGFSNISNFNRQFKKLKKTTPTDYRNHIFG